MVDHAEHQTYGPGRHTVVGALRDGATVRTGGVLTVQGSVDGSLIVEDDAAAIIHGAFFGVIERNGGLVMLNGCVDTPFGPRVGRVTVGVDSVIDGPHGPGVLRADGAVDPIHDDEPIPASRNVNTDVVCFYDAADDRFVPLGDTHMCR